MFSCTTKAHRKKKHQIPKKCWWLQGLQNLTTTWMHENWEQPEKLTCKSFADSSSEGKGSAGTAWGAAGPLLFREMKESGRERWREVEAVVVVRRERNTGSVLQFCPQFRQRGGEESEAAAAEEEEAGPRNGRVGTSNSDACIVFWKV